MGSSSRVFRTRQAGPWRTVPPLANGSERAQVLPGLDAIHLRTGKRGCPRKGLRVIAADNGYAAQNLHQLLRTRGIRAQMRETRLADQETAWQTHQDRCPSFPR